MTSTTPHARTQAATDGDARLRAVDVPGHAAPHANHVWRRRAGVGDVRRYDVDIMSCGAGLAGEVMHVLAHAAEVGVVVLRN